jgi:hypothetical protein
MELRFVESGLIMTATAKQVFFRIVKPKFISENLSHSSSEIESAYKKKKKVPAE